MKFKGKEVCGIKVYDHDTLIATICDDRIETTNGYRIEVIPKMEHVSTNED